MINRAFLFPLLLSAGLAHAQQYRWVDDKGQVRYSDTPPPATAKQVEKKAAPVEPAAAAPQQEPFELQQLKKDFPVTLYTAPICKMPCELARSALNKRGVPFTEIQVWTPETLEQLKASAGSDNVPALVVGRSAQSGFDQARFDSLLDSAGYPKAGQLPVRSQAAPPAPEGYVPPPTAEPVKPEPDATRASGPYDTSGLKSSGPPRPSGLYDPSGLKSNAPAKQGPYGLPGSSN